MGDEAVLIEVADIGEMLALRAHLEQAAAAGPASWAAVDELVSGARTVLVRLHPGADLAAARRLLRGEVNAPADHPAESLNRDEGVAAAGPTVEVAVTYDGPDLDDVARATGLTTDAVVGAHTGTPWRVAFGGFAPGFAYLVGGDPRLRVPRRPSPRARVPAGAVALAGEFSGIYPQDSPGGWQLIGRTTAPLWDVDRDPPALLTPGTTVRFTCADRPAEERRRSAPDRPGDGHRGEHVRAVEVLATGPLALVQDHGRPGLADVGVGRSGAADRAAHDLGARLVGQPESLASLESTLGGLVVRARGDLVVALTGAQAPADADGRPVPTAAPFPLRSGQVLTVGMPLSSLRTYLTVRGGLAPPAVLGSHSTDTLSGIGPSAVVPGQVLPVGPPPRRHPDTDLAPLAPAPAPGETVVLGVLPGPRLDWFADPGALATHWTVSELSNRVGIRLSGKPAQRHTAWVGRELPSEGMVRGAIQVPPNGEPVILLADHPVTGGYPVIGVLPSADADRAAQLRPGQRVRLRWSEG